MPYDPVTGAWVPTTKRPYPDAAAYTGDDVALPYSAADIARQQREGWRDAGVAASIGLAAQGGQTALSYIDTPQDTYNRERLAALEKHRGLSAGDRQDIDERAMRGVRALSTENRARDEARLASSGGHSAADIARVRRDSEKNLSDASIQAADIGIQANREQVAKDTQEAEERRAYESTRQRSRIEGWGQTIAGLANTLAAPLANQATPTGATDAQIVAMMQAKDASGHPVFPGMQGLSVADARALYQSQVAAARRPDGAVVPGQAVPGR